MIIAKTAMFSAKKSELEQRLSRLMKQLLGSCFFSHFELDAIRPSRAQGELGGKKKEKRRRRPFKLLFKEGMQA